MKKTLLVILAILMSAMLCFTACDDSSSRKNRLKKTRMMKLRPRRPLTTNT